MHPRFWSLAALLSITASLSAFLTFWRLAEVDTVLQILEKKVG